MLLWGVSTDRSVTYFLRLRRWVGAFSVFVVALAWGLIAWFAPEPISDWWGDGRWVAASIGLVGAAVAIVHQTLRCYLAFRARHFVELAFGSAFLILIGLVVFERAPFFEHVRWENHFPDQ
jgi:hypothetical protein